jgi:hypothetical protein
MSRLSRGLFLRDRSQLLTSSLNEYANVSFISTSQPGKVKFRRVEAGWSNFYLYLGARHLLVVRRLSGYVNAAKLECWGDQLFA